MFPEQLPYGAEARCLLEVLAQSERRVYTIAMFQVFVNAYVSLMAELQTLETEIMEEWTFPPPIRPPREVPTMQQKQEKLAHTLLRAEAYSQGLSFLSTTRQIARIRNRFNQEPRMVPHSELSVMIAELRVRISEDLQDRVFFAITDPIRIQKFFKRSTEEGTNGYLIWKELDEIFDPKVVERFPQTYDDLSQACECIVHSLPTACVFHLMRVVEIGVLKVARLADIQDPKPSWGSILNRLDKLAHRTEYKDLPPCVQPHIELVKKLLPKLHAIQHAWRNKVSHVEDKLIPTDSISGDDALEIMTAVQAFMRMLAAELPSAENSSGNGR